MTSSPSPGRCPGLSDPAPSGPIPDSGSLLLAEQLRRERVARAATLVALGLADHHVGAVLDLALDDLGHQAVADAGLDLHRPHEAVVLDPQHAAVVLLLGAARLLLRGLLPLGGDVVLAELRHHQ